MILLDSNVLSALMQLAPDEKVAKWLNAQVPDSIWTTTVTVMEVRAGLLAMPTGRRRDTLTRSFTILLDEKIKGRIASFDLTAAEQAADLIATRKARGRMMELRDTMIAGIALATRSSLATRNTSHFADLSVPVINPWNE